MEFCYSMLALQSGLMRDGVPSRRDASFDIQIDVIKSCNLVGNREYLVDRAIKRGHTHLLFLDDDMQFPPQTIDLLFSRRAPIVVTNYLIKSEEPEFVAVDFVGRPVPTRAEDSGVVPVQFSGFGCSLFDIDVFRQIEQPWFTHEWTGDTHTTEDYPFYKRARAAGFEVLLDHDASKLISHVGRKVWRWDEWQPKGEGYGQLENAG